MTYIYYNIVVIIIIKPLPNTILYLPMYLYKNSTFSMYLNNYLVNVYFYNVHFLHDHLYKIGMYLHEFVTY